MRASLVLLAALVVACNRAPEQPHAAPTPIAERPRDPELPLTLTVRGPRAVAEGSTIDVAVTIERFVGDGPMELFVNVPKGTALVGGAARETVPHSQAPIARTYRVRVDALPAADLVVEVDAPGVSQGAHAKAAYRFGRPEPKLPDPGGTYNPDP